jgi:Lon protease-like protein
VDELSADELAAIAVFPLPRVVLFPGTLLPLHVFEPRYRAMMHDCVTRERLVMSVAQLTGDWQRDYSGSPPIHPVAGAGRIVQHRENADGTYDLVLSGLVRVRLDELPPEGLPYRRARATVLRERVPAQGLDPADVAALWTLAAQVGAMIHELDPRFELRASPDDDPPRMIDRIADQLVPDADLRQDLLETLDVAERLRVTQSRVAQLHLSLMDAKPGDRRTLN